jgi:hypothetical protein
MTKRSVQRLGLALLVGIWAGGALLSCGGKDKPAQNPTGTTSASVIPPPPPPSSAPATSASASASANPLTTVLTTDPNQLAAMFSAAASAAAAMMQPPGTGGGGDPVEAGIKAVAAKHAPGMQPDGPIAKGTLQEGGHLSMMVTLQAGKCYSIVGFSPKDGVKDLDLHLLAPPFYNILSGEDTTDDNTPVIGKGPNAMCPVIPVAIPYKVDITAQKGAGAVGVQLYSKAK